MKKWAPGSILLVLLFSMAFIGVSLAQANDPYFQSPPNTFVPPGSTPTPPPPTPGQTIVPTPACRAAADADLKDDNDPCFPEVPGSVDPPLGFDDDEDPGGPAGPGGGDGPGDDVKGKDLENQLPQERGTTVPSGSSLPFTGAQLMWFLIAGVAATTTGFVLWRQSRNF